MSQEPVNLLTTAFTSVNAKTQARFVIDQLRQKLHRFNYLVIFDPKSIRFYLKEKTSFEHQFKKMQKRGQTWNAQMSRFLRNAEPIDFITLDTKLDPDITKALVIHDNYIVGIFNPNEKSNLTGVSLDQLIPVQTIHKWISQEAARFGTEFKVLDYNNLYKDIADSLVNEVESTAGDKGPIVPVLGGGLVIGNGGPPGPGNGGKGSDEGGGDGDRGGGGSRNDKPYFLNVEYSKEIYLDEILNVLVSIDRNGLSGPALPMLIPDNADVEILVFAGTAFDQPERPNNSIKIPDSVGKTCHFTLRSTTAGDGSFRVFAFIDGREIASVELTVKIKAKKPQPAVANSPAAYSEPINISKIGILPDLNLLIVATKSKLEIRVSAIDRTMNLNYTLFESTLDAPPKTHFDNLFKEIENLPLYTADDREIATRRMRRKGAETYRALLPPTLRSLLWEIKDRISTVIINSTEPWVPWEMCFIEQDIGNSVSTDQFFCERFNITRWIPGSSSPLNIKISKVALIVPQTSGLPYANEERDALKTILEGAGKTVDKIEPVFLAVDDALASGEYSVIHFTGHGSVKDTGYSNSPAIHLDDGKMFRPDDINGQTRNLGMAAPIVFLNACQVGRIIQGLTGVAGWAEKFLQTKASVFIGAHWAINDKLACQFATSFYKSLLSGETVGSAVRSARLALKASGDPTWLAYTVFADPNATIKS